MNKPNVFLSTVAGLLTCAGIHAAQPPSAANSISDPQGLFFWNSRASATRAANQAWLNQIRKPYEYELGRGNGTGVVVGVVDSGVQVDHPALAGKIAATYNVFTDGTDAVDQIGHGTYVSGIIAGNGSIEGVAPGARLAVAKVFGSGPGPSVFVEIGMDWAVNVQRVPIMSLSLGSQDGGGFNFYYSMKNAVNKGVLVTAALGNNGASTGLWPAKYASEDWANGQVIAVGAVDANNKKADFSNYDPALAKWTVFAPGVNISSSYAGSSYVAASGTSIATPMVAGQAALLKSNWGFLTASNMAQIIFQSATRLCSDNVSSQACSVRNTPDPVYGWGLINVGASLQPIGGLSMTARGGFFSWLNTAFFNSKTGVMSRLPFLSSLAVDKFNRGYLISFFGSKATPTQSAASVPLAATPVLSSNGSKFSASYEQVASSTASLVNPAAKPELALKMSYSFEDKNGTSYAFGTRKSTDSFFGLQASGLAPLSLSGQDSRFNAPYFGMVEGATHVGYGLTLQNGATLRFGYLTQRDLMGVSTALAAQSTPGSSASNSKLAAIELQRSWGANTGVVTVGQLQEANALLGATGTGAFALGVNAKTTFVTFAGAHALSPQATLSAMVSTGVTPGFENTATSLIDGASASVSRAWSVGLAYRDLHRSGDQLGLSLSMPLKTISGTLRATTATEQNQTDGSLLYNTQQLSMRPTGTEKNMDLSYATPIRQGGVLRVLTQLKFQPGHDAQAPTQFGIGFRYERPLR